MSRPVRAYAFGTFDGLHAGHRSYFAQARALGDHLTVVVARDDNVERIKGFRPVCDEQQRKTLVKESGLADHVILGLKGDPLEIFESQKIDVVVLGYDQQVSEREISQAARHSGQHPKIARARPYRPYLYKNSILRLLGPLGRWLRTR